MEDKAKKANISWFDSQNVMRDLSFQRTGLNSQQQYLATKDTTFDRMLSTIDKLREELLL